MMNQKLSTIKFTGYPVSCRKTFLLFQSLCLAGLFLCGSSLQAQDWREIQRFNPAQTIQKIRFLNSELGYCTSSLYNGSTMNIYKTTNGGLSFTPQNSGYSATRFMDIFILDEQTVWISGNEGLILHTRDGGLKWETQNSGTREQIWGICFTDEKHGHACGANGSLLRTTDGGQNWEQRPSGINNLFYAIYFIDGHKGFASGSNVLMRTDDGGENWYKVTGFPFSPPADWIRRIVFVDGQTGYACADIGRIYKTTDGGDNWIRLESGVQEALMDLDFADDQVGVAVGFNGTILRTVNGGTSWEQMQSPLGAEHLFSVDLISRNLGYIATHQGRILKNDLFATAVKESNRETEIRIFSNGNQLLLEGLEEDSECRFFDMQGRSLPLRAIRREQNRIVFDQPILIPGIYQALLQNGKGKTQIRFFISQ